MAKVRYTVMPKTAKGVSKEKKVRYTVMPKTAKGVSKEKAEEVRQYVNMTGHRAKVTRIGQDKYRVYTSSPSLRR